MQAESPFSSVVINGHGVGSLQQAPHRLHFPLRFSSIGNTLVAVRFSLAGQVFFEKDFILKAIINTKAKNNTFFSLCNKLVSDTVFICVKALEYAQQ